MGVFHVVQRNVWRRAVFVVVMLALAVVMYVFSVPGDTQPAVSGTKLMLDWLSQTFGGRSTDTDALTAVAALDEAVAEPAVPVTVRVEPLSQQLFAEYKLERERNRAFQLEQLEQLLAKSPEATQQRADIVALLQRSEQELQIEVLLQARGWGESLVIITDSGLIVVMPESINAAAAEAIGNVAAKVANVPLEHITISDGLSLR